MSTSICQECYTFNCSWHESFTPVKNWEAVSTITGGCESYRVIRCPKFCTRNGDAFVQVTGTYIAKLLRCSLRTMMRSLEKGTIASQLLALGYIFKVDRPYDKNQRFYIKLKEIK